MENAAAGLISRLTQGPEYVTCPHCGGNGKSGKRDSQGGFELPCRTCQGWKRVDKRTLPEAFKQEAEDAANA